MMGTPVSPYIRVEYLKTDGYSFINTGVTADNSDVISFDFLINTFATYGSVFANYVNEQTNTTRLILTNSNNGTMYANINQAASTPFTISNIPIATRHQVTMSRSGITVDGVTTSFGTPTAGNPNTTPLVLFRNKYDNTSAVGTGVQIYSFSIVRGGIRIIDLVPVVRISDNEPGMLDRVSGHFFTNAGSGNFIVGNTLTT